MPEIIPAILTNDISDLQKKYSELFSLSDKFSKLHVDFIDGEFLPGKTVMPQDLHLAHAPFHLIAHLMVYKPEQYFQELVRSGFDAVIVQWEAFANKIELEKVIDLAHQSKLKIGLAFNPETKVHELGRYVNAFDVIQVMGVHPGAQGRGFEADTLEKVSELKKLKANAIIAVDGGAKVGSARQIAEAGADWIIAGSAMWRGNHPKLSLEELIEDIK